MEKVINMHKLFRLQLIALFVSIFFFVTYAFASSDTNLSPKRGEGVGMISGWNVSSVHYRLAEDPSKIRAVEFDLDGSATRVAIGFNSASDRTFSCYNINGHHWLCEVGGIEVARINSLRVIAVS
jgi:hypothetical protein